jgi:serine/threonine protein kinase
MVEQLFHEALECDDAFRAGFLAKACAGDVELLAEVASLLASYERDRNFLQKSAFNRSALEVAGTVLEEKASEVPEVPRVKGFHLVREVGRGGMGAVYEAFSANGEIAHRVAIKLVKRGMDTEFVLRRFDRERRILRALDHPYIARLRDGGATDDGLPFFVMEYVDGLPIDRYVRERTLSTTERLKLFLKVCEAVSYAHRHRVIHRDLKPSNILVTEDGAPKLLDFGVAKLLDLDSVGNTADVTATAMAHRVMTPEYASPSQLRGLPPMERDDVYSLGLLLYILLTGVHPYHFRSRVPEEILRSIGEGRIRRPSEVVDDVSVSTSGATDTAVSSRRGAELHRELRGNLDKVVMKALSKESERRYASVEEMARDIHHHLAGRPVSARDDSLAYRASERRSAFAPAIMPLVVGLFLLLTLFLALRLQGANKIEVVGPNTRTRGLDYSARLGELSDLRLKFAQLDSEARARHRTESQRELAPPFHIKLDKAREEARKAMVLMDHPPLSENQDWVNLRRTLESYLAITQDRRRYGLEGFKSFQRVDAELNNLYLKERGRARENH